MRVEEPTHARGHTQAHTHTSDPPSIPLSLLWCLSDVITSQDNGGRKREMDGDKREGRSKVRSSVCVCVCAREKTEKEKEWEKWGG